MNEGPNMATFGERQARRFFERKGYARESLHLYRPGPEIVGKWVTKLKQSVGPEGATLMPERKRVTEPFSTWMKNRAFWFLDLASSKRRSQSKQFEQTLTIWKRPQTLVRLGCFYERTGWKPRHVAG